MKNQDWWNRSESFSAFQGVEPSKVETEKMKAISFGLKELWQEKNGCGIREPSSELFKILTFFEIKTRNREGFSKNTSDIASQILGANCDFRRSPHVTWAREMQWWWSSA